MSQSVRVASALLLLGSGILAASDSSRLKVVTSFLPIYCFAVNVAGDEADVQNLMPAGVTPHDYQFSRRDLEKLTDADLVIINGLGMETWLGRLLRNSDSKRKMELITLSASLEKELIYDQPNNPNPHIWLDPKLAAHGLTNILKAFQKADPPNAAKYAANASNYLHRLEKLDSELEVALSPYAGVAVMTYHAALPYFARRYGLTVVGVFEPVPEISPSARHLASLREAARTQNVRAILTDTPTPPRIAERFANDLGIPVVSLDILESGALSAAAYETGMRSNVAALTRVLGKGRR